MKWLTLTAALLVCSVGTNNADAGLFDMFDSVNLDILNLDGHGGCCNPAPKCCAPKPVCCKPAPKCCAPKPVCCKPAPKCCAPKAKCCAPKAKCCAPKAKCCAPKAKCCAPKPVCCKPKCCDPCCKKGFLDGLFDSGHDLISGLFDGHGCGCGH